MFLICKPAGSVSSKIRACSLASSRTTSRTCLAQRWPNEKDASRSATRSRNASSRSRVRSPVQRAICVSANPVASGLRQSFSRRRWTHRAAFSLRTTQFAGPYMSDRAPRRDSAQSSWSDAFPFSMSRTRASPILFLASAASLSQLAATCHISRTSCGPAFRLPDCF